MTFHTLPTPDWEAVSYAGHSYQFTREWLDDRGYRYGLDERGPVTLASYVDEFGPRKDVPLDVPLCGGCDRPITHHRCEACQLVFVEELGDGRIAA